MQNPWEVDWEAEAPAGPGGLVAVTPPPVENAPSGYRYQGGRLVPIPGGPADKPAGGDDAPSGYRWGPAGVLAAIPGGPADKSRVAAAKPVPQGSAEKLEQAISTYGTMKESLTSFQDDFAGSAFAGLENKAQGWLGVGTPGQRNWWARFQAMDNAVRNDLFGATLTPSEQASYLGTTISPSMDPKILKENLASRAEIIRKALARKTAFLKANNFDADAVDALLGEYAPDIYGNQTRLSAAPGEVQFEDQAPQTPQGARLTAEQEQRLQAFLATKPAPHEIVQFVASLNVPGLAADPENARALAEAAKQGRVSGDVDYSQVDAAAAAAARAEVKNSPVQNAASDTLLTQGMTLGLSDEAAGIGRGLSRLAQGRSPLEGYTLGRDAERLRIQDARGELGGAGTALEIGGSLMSGNIASAFRAAPTLGGRMAQGARAGAYGGGISGYGYGEGAEGSTVNALLGATVGAGAGAALPVLGDYASRTVGGARRMIGRDPALPRRLVSDAIQADGNTPRAVGQMMDDASGRGSPMMLADTGDNARGLLASVGRQPGPSRTITRDAVYNRQMGQTDRISEAVVRDLGPTANIREMGESLVERARRAAAPLYDQAYAAPGASTVQLDDLANRPAFQRALRNAHNLAREEGVDPTALGFDLNDAGEVVLNRVPSFQTLDYVKRGLDDVVETYRDTTTGRLNLNTQGRATNATLRTLLARLDRANPTYAQARAAYAGPARMREALDKGAKALNKSPDDIMAMMRGFGEGEQEAFRLGIRKSIVDMLGTKRDGADKVGLLLGSPKSRTVLTRIFGGRAEFERFVATLQDEQAMNRTYTSVTGNSATAERLAQDATTDDAGLLERATSSAIRGGRNGSILGGMVGDLLEAARTTNRFGPGTAGERARESVAALLTETDPAVLRELMIAARRAAAQQRVSAGRQGRRAVQQGRATGNLLGTGIGRASEKEPRK